jgi:hypothetical protein
LWFRGGRLGERGGYGRSDSGSDCSNPWDYAELRLNKYQGRFGGESSILRIEGRTKAGLGLVLGVMVGLGLVVLPGVIAPSTSTELGSNSRVTPSTQSLQPGNPNNQSNEASSAFNEGSLLVLVGALLFPAIALSFLARSWTLRRAKVRLGSEN